MGNRHQLFIIARRPHGEYTCLTKVYFQCIYEEICDVATRFIALIKEPFNGAMVESELCALDDPDNKNAKRRVPCPYVNKLINDALIGAGYDRYSRFDSRKKDPKGDDNNSGITILDVTQQLAPRYCFVNIGPIELSCFAESFNPPRGAPLSVKDYLECMYGFQLNHLLSSDFEDHTKAQCFYDGLKAEPVLPLWMFRNWSYSTYDGNCWRNFGKRCHSRSPIPSLADMALSIVASLPYQVVADLHQSFDVPINQFTAKKALEYLRGRDDMPETLLPLLGSSLALLHHQDYQDLNFDGYPLTTVQLLRLSAPFTDTRSLNVSNNSRINKDTVQLLVKAMPTVERLVLVNCPSLTYRDMDALVEEGVFASLDRVVCIDGEALWTFPGGLWAHPDLPFDDDGKE